MRRGMVSSTINKEAKGSFVLESMRPSITPAPVLIAATERESRSEFEKLCTVLL
jgi:hypothetical protein